MMLNRLLFLIVAITLLSCETSSNKEAEIEKIHVDFEVTRFDKEFANADVKSLPKLKEKFPFLFPEQYAQNIWIQKLDDTLQHEIETEVEKAFPEFSEETDQLHSLFQHAIYYLPRFQVPHVITLTSEVDYKNKSLYSGEYLLISLDTYLGEDHPFYIGLQEYLKKNFRKEQIVPDAAAEIAKQYVSRAENRTFLAYMIYYGKILYLKDLLIPSVTDEEKIGYTPEELQWAQNNEDQIWRYFVENELIYDTDSQLYTRFLYPAPFSKFYLELDAESPDRLGQYIGWNIVRSYMNKNDVSVEKMLSASSEEIFNNAKYKPKK